ncbi:RNA polymerase Rpb1 domain 5 [Carpediemonas membranifera]|uniref:DNA-directed RNA polymerase subunit n=1 Tax=Carpediemonas membranifera TaxID=201153 RepID=A0A8J6AVP2_9EUKA|nr:RNA polymerase Rpb1 domain 5 [Carpediemonas membranifera]|eukprot:KAG9395956.1 RNA polymerase Rpb1 domain 5 [Carpediemonas membranifera]
MASFQGQAPLKLASEVQFSILSPEQIEALSVGEITQHERYNNGIPLKGGLADKSLGSIDRGVVCDQCQGEEDCPGHFGHIRLAKPVYHIGHLDTIHSVLRCICLSCGSLRFDRGSDKFAAIVDSLNSYSDRTERLRAIVSACNSCKTCPECGCTLFDVTKKRGESSDKPLTKTPHWFVRKYRPPALKDDPTLKDSDITTEEALAALTKMKDVDITFLGMDPVYARPENLIIRSLLVPPPHVRPSVKMDNTSSEDDLTYILTSIVRSNNELRESIERNQVNAIDGRHNALQCLVVNYFNNSLPSFEAATHTTSRPLKTIKDRIDGKAGRIRQNLMGKRVNFTARTVITGDPLLGIDEVGVPMKAAMILTYPERVTPANMAWLERLVGNGPKTYPGANYIIRDDGVRIALGERSTSSVTIAVGYIVERHILDGDYVMFNRQPSLHKMSLMGHRAKVMPYSTFRLNLSVTTPYNADFDGDEMNLHVPQSLEARAEVKHIMATPKQIITPQGNKPVIGIVQDTLLGSNLLTRRDEFITKKEMMNLMMWLPDWDGVMPSPAVVFPTPLWTGKQIISALLPKVNLVAFHASHDKADTSVAPIADTRVIVRNGTLIAGMLCKKTLGTSAGGLVHIVWKDIGPEETRDMLGGIQRIIAAWFIGHGFSVGIGDCVAHEDTLGKIERTLAERHTACNNYFTQACSGQLRLMPGQTMRSAMEAKMNSELNSLINLCGKIVEKDLSKRNNFKRMAGAGSKGSLINLSQIIATVGQQNVEGQRLPCNFKNRTLPSYSQFDYGPLSRGFVNNSYLKGLTPTEVYFHAMGGREGLIDTSIKTSFVGYAQRRLMKAMEDIRVEYDLSVRDSQGEVYEFLYGEDGIDSTQIEFERFPTLTVGDRELQRRYRFTEDELVSQFGPGVRPEIQSEAGQRILEQEFEQIMMDRDELRDILCDPITHKLESRFAMAIPIQRLIQNRVVDISADPRKESDLSPVAVVRLVRETIDSLRLIRGTGDLALNADKMSRKLLEILLRSHLASKDVCLRHKLTESAVKSIMSEIISRYNHAAVAPGESVGPVAAQSIGEPATQMTLNTFHFAGFSGKNVTLGVPRLTEIINVNKTEQVKAPSLSIALKPEYAQNEAQAKEVQAELEYTRFSDLVETCDIVYDPDPSNSTMEEDRPWLRMYTLIDDLRPAQADAYNPYTLRYVLKIDKVHDKAIFMREIVSTFEDEFVEADQHCRVFHSDDNARKMVIRVLLPRESGYGVDQVDDIENDDIDQTMIAAATEAHDRLSDAKFRGIHGLKKVFIEQEKAIYILNKETGVMETGDTITEWKLDTEGTALREVFKNNKVDASKTVSNCITEVYDVLGIEAARGAIVNEIRMVLGFDGAYTNYRHFSLLANVMCAKGYIMSITRHGISKRSSGPFMRSSFEQSTDILTKAAAFGLKDDLRSNSASVMFGRPMSTGTGSMSLCIDPQMVVQAPQVQSTATALTLDRDNLTPEQQLGDDGDLSMAQGASYQNLIFSPEAETMTTTVGGMNPRSPWMTPMTAGTAMSALGTVGLSAGFTAGAMTPGMSMGFGASGGGASMNFMSAMMSASPNYSPGGQAGSPVYSPTSPHATSVNYSAAGGASSQMSPAYSPTGGSAMSPAYSPGQAGGASPAYSPGGQMNSPVSPAYGAASPGQMSPAYHD